MSNDTTASLRRWLLSLPPIEYVLQHLRDTLVGSLKQGPIPQHIAFVMDGNRRYAREHHLETVEGHHLGFEALARILEVCYKSGVKCVTIYAFSIENFKRSKYEVDGLMDMAKTRLVQMAQHGELFERYGAAVRVLGDRSLVREDVLAQIDRASEMTAGNRSAVLNVCFPYTSREEITYSIRETVREYSEVPAPATSEKSARGAPRSFSESHIQHSIRSRKLSSVAEDGEAGDTQPGARNARPLRTGPLTFTREDGSVVTSDTDSPSNTNSDDAASTTSASEDHDRETSASTTSPPPPASSAATSHSPSPVLKPTTPTPLTAKTSNPINLPDPETITPATLTANTYTAPCPPLDLLVRTSGVCRLSDFMLWQAHERTRIRFLECLWPDFDLWHFLPVLLEWQWREMGRGAGSQTEREGGEGKGDGVA